MKTYNIKLTTEQMDYIQSALQHKVNSTRQVFLDQYESIKSRGEVDAWAQRIEQLETRVRSFKGKVRHARSQG